MVVFIELIKRYNMEIINEPISEQEHLENVKRYEELIAKQNKINELKAELSKLSEDIIQSQVGEIVPNIEERKTRFIALHNELRSLEGKEPRKTYSI